MDIAVSGWREALAIALNRALRIEHDVDGAPYALCGQAGHRLPAIDDCLRRFAWKPTMPGGVWPLQMSPPEEESDAQLFCVGCHADGHMRERALRLARERPRRLATALALIRCDDWVPQVREAAVETLRLQIEADPALVFAQIDLLLALRGRQRFDAGVWPALIEPALLAPEQRAERWALLEHGHGKARLLACTLILRADHDRIAQLALRAVRDRDPVIARWALRDLPSLADIRQGKDGFQEDMLAQALRHSSASVRAQALRVRGGRPDAAYAALVRDALLDASASVRAVAIHAARQLDIDARAIFRDALDRGESPRNRHALQALGDCADADDLDRLRPWLHHPAGESRCAALRGALRAGIDDPAGVLHDALTSPSGKVVSLALKLGATVPSFMTRETLAGAFVAATSGAARKRLLDATHRIDRWSALDCLLDCSTHAAHDEDVQTALRAWAYETGNRFAPLSTTRRHSLLARIDAMTPQSMHIAWLPIRRVVESS
jgi:hypothetical protein